MTQKFKKLASLGGVALRAESPDVARLERTYGGFAADNIGRLLRVKNGFYAFEGALHVLPDVGARPSRGIYEWNDAALWRADYERLADDTVFFAEDVFGTQFCVHDGAIATFDPETGAFERIAADAEEWAANILGDYSFWTGHSVAREWQMRHGALPVGFRLVPITPFVLGGKFEATNVRAADAVAGMKYRASIAVQIRDVPDGASIRLSVVE